MEQLALILAKRVIELDPQAVPRLLWEAAKLYRQCASVEEQQKLLAFQASLCKLSGRPATSFESEQQAAAFIVDQSAH